MAVLLALVSAGAYGLSDFLGGIFSRRSAPWPIAVVGQSSSAVCALVLAVAIGGTVTAHDWAWGAVAGIGAGVGAAFLYRGLAAGRMSVVAPISALGSAIVPVGVGLLTGDRPSLLAWVGIVFAFPAIYLISRMSDDPAAAHDGGGVVDGVLAGLGFGSMFAILGQVDSDAGMYPLALMQVTSVLSVIATATLLRTAWLPRDRLAWRAAMMGPLGATATGAFLYATHTGLLTLVSVVAALYPALTVLLAAVVLREHIHRTQAVGLALAAAAVSLVAAA
ncbi:EamA family transporter [Solicola gregarius]|uniref:EamA family transporter n=1 Tax=Solicola gregarius TaxID=2908642 RepID=A0AA46YIX8_9ACTN|nr:EamA family transporter [Solicola gregarius]UYM03522.1 EamA family transporter [Solicola gregarius]